MHIFLISMLIIPLELTKSKMAIDIKEPQPEGQGKPGV
jgi:hypothetical protein